MEPEQLTHEAAAALLDRYFAAETTLAEEKRLRAYFRSGQAAPELQPYRALFGYWDRLGRSAAPAPVRPLRRRPRRRYLAAAAAVLLLMLGVLAYPDPPARPLAAAEPAPIDWSKYEVTDPEEAVRVLHGALKTASTELHRGAGLTVEGVREVSRVLD